MPLMTVSRNDPTMVRMEDVHLTLAGAAGSVNILRGIDLEIGAGETVGLVGPSGSGKTSLLMTIAGLERPTRGKISVAGTELSSLDEDGLALLRRDALGIVFQNFHLIPTMTAQENVALPLELAGAPDPQSRARAALEAVGLGARLGHYPGELSGGEEQRVAIARAFIAEPKLLLADEPTGNLDSKTGDGVMNLLFDLAASRGTTLVLVTHETRLTERCGRLLRLDDGCLAADSGARRDSAGTARS
jgi:putative ABC transport system ATP-binding protein